MDLYRKEIFNPMLMCMEMNNLEKTIELINANPYGNDTNLFTRSNGTTRHFQHAMKVNQVNINVPIPIPLPFFSFTN